MQLYCAKCNSQHASTGRCPRCSSRLLSPTEAADILPKAALQTPNTQVESSFLRRVVVGTLLAMGLHLGLREWALAAMTFADLGTQSAVWPAINFTLRGVSLAVAALLAGAGHRQGTTAGSLVGAFSGAGLLFVDSYPVFSLEFTSIAEAVGLVVFGGLLGKLGMKIWPPPVAVANVPTSRDSSLLKLKPDAGDAGNQPVIPTSWIRIVLATTLVGCSMMLAARAATGVSAITPNPVETLKDPLTLPRLETALLTLMVLFAGLLAGAGTGAGLRHGAIAGALGALAMLGLLQLSPDQPWKSLYYTQRLLELEDGSAQAILAVGAGVAATVAIGGWLGGQFFPKLAKSRRRRRRTD